jgi:hypothetical protein
LFFLKLRYIKKNKIKLFKKNYFKFKEKYFFKINLKNKFKLFNYYNHYNNSFFFKKNFNNIKYEKLLTFIILKKVKILHLNFKFFDINNILILNNFILLYNFFLNSIYIDIFYFTKFLKIKNRILFYLTFSFKKKKLYINLQNKKKKNYISISTGLFIKFFEKRKSIKKNKAIKLLMAKYLRKLFIISKINNLILVIKKTPLFINELINFLNTPIAHKFLNPIDQKIVDESINKNLSIRFLYFIFMENKNFSKNKIASKGRIKRKILRKITFENRIID